MVLRPICLELTLSHLSPGARAARLRASRRRTAARENIEEYVSQARHAPEREESTRVESSRTRLAPMASMLVCGYARRLGAKA